MYASNSDLVCVCMSTVFKRITQSDSQPKMTCIKMLMLVLITAATLTLRDTSAKGNPYLDVYPKFVSTNGSIPLYFGLMLSLSGDQQSTGALAGVQAALDIINSKDDLLPGYSLHYTLTDSQVEYFVVVVVFMITNS